LKLKITVDGKLYEVDVEAAEEAAGPTPAAYGTYYPQPSSASVPAPAAPPAPAGTAAPGGAIAEDKVCRSPIAGVVVRVNAQPNQQIQVNDPLLVLEAMKMETNITSPVSGKIKAINVGPGEAVQVGQVLVEFE
jgi:biotin carboxyl carrier protein